MHELFSLILMICWAKLEHEVQEGDSVHNLLKIHEQFELMQLFPPKSGGHTETDTLPSQLEIMLISSHFEKILMC